MSGHSKWATIKHTKGVVDAKRGKLFTKLIKEITVAARLGGGVVENNPRLRKAIADAKSKSMPGDTIKNAVKRGTGEIEGPPVDEVIYEGTGVGGVLFLIEGTTDNRNRTVAELRKIFEKAGGVLGAAGTAAWAFDRKGQIQIEKSAAKLGRFGPATPAAVVDQEKQRSVEFAALLATMREQLERLDA